MVDLRSITPEDVQDFFESLKDAITGVSTEWWDANKNTMAGYITSLSEAVVETTLALKQERISEETADQIYRMQQAAFRQTIRYTRFMTYVLAQKIVNAVFEIVAAAIKNYTGINFFPELLSD